MNLSVTLAGSTIPWRFHGSTALDAWLADRPWLGRGGVKVVRVAAAEYAAEVARAVRRGILAHDDGASEVRVHRLEVAAPGGFRGAVGDALGLAPGLDRGDYLRQAVRVLEYRPTVFLCEPAASPAAPSLLDQAETFVEEVSKTGSGPPATVVLFDTPAAPLSGEAYDLAVGGPSEGVLKDAERGESALWRAYVHTRLAWEAAGDLGRAAAWNEGGFAGLPTGKDESLEALLNRCAADSLAQLPQATRDLLAAHLDQLVKRPRTRPGERGAALQLVAAGVLWCPPGESRPRPAPWAARALLESRRAEDARFLLRGCLVCAPLARELLNRCFDLEARERVQCWAGRGSCTLSQEVKDRFGRFMTGDPASEYPFYPPGCPAAPTDEWPFATFGELLYVLRQVRPVSPHLFDLRDLRNALAHGHYAGWHAVSVLRRIELQADR